MIKASEKETVSMPYAEYERDIIAAAAVALRQAATWATQPDGTVSVKRLLDEADKLEGK